MRVRELQIAYRRRPDLPLVDDPKTLTCPTDVVDLLRAILESEPVEVFAILCLTTLRHFLSRPHAHPGAGRRDRRRRGHRASAMTIGSGASMNTGCCPGGPHATRTMFGRRIVVAVAWTGAGLVRDTKRNSEHPCKVTWWRVPARRCLSGFCLGSTETLQFLHTIRPRTFANPVTPLRLVDPLFVQSGGSVYGQTGFKRIPSILPRTGVGFSSISTAFRKRRCCRA